MTRLPGPPTGGFGRGALAVTSRSPRAGVLVIAPAGELDLDTVPVLRPALLDAIAGEAGTVVVDCTNLGFCDSAGLNLLLQARQAAEERGTGLRLAAVGGRLARLLHSAGAQAVFAIDPRPPA